MHESSKSACKVGSDDSRLGILHLAQGGGFSIYGASYRITFTTDLIPIKDGSEMRKFGILNVEGSRKSHSARQICNSCSSSLRLGLPVWGENVEFQKLWTVGNCTL